MDAESGDNDKDGLTSEWGGESRQDWRGWRNESGSWFQRRGYAYLNKGYLTVPEPFDPGPSVPGPPVPESAEYWPWTMAISYSISDSRPTCYGWIGSSSRISCV